MKLASPIRIFLLATLVSSAFAGQHFTGSSYVYHFDNLEVIATLVRDQVVVRFTKGASDSVQQEFLKMNKLNKAVDQAGLFHHRLVLCNVPPEVAKLDDRSFVTILNAWNADPRIEFITPVLQLGDYEEDRAVILDRVIAKVRYGEQDKQVSDLLDHFGLEVAGTITRSGILDLRIPTTSQQNPLDVAAELDETDVVEWSAPLWLRRVRLLELVPNDPFFQHQWTLSNSGTNHDQNAAIVGADVQATHAWEIATGDDVIVAVIDEGVDIDHPEFAGRMLGGRNFFTDPPNDNPDAIGNDAHGTCVAGIIGAAGNNDAGISGVNWNCRIIPMKISEDAVFATTLAIANAIDWVVDQGAQVLNNSWMVGCAPDPAIHTAIDRATSLNCLIVCAAGNGQCSGNIVYPASDTLSLAVGATDAEDLRWYYSNTGSELDVVAPSGDAGGSGDMWSTDILGLPGYSTDDYADDFGGTSGAAPIVTGIAALLLSIDPSLTSVQVQAYIQAGAEDQVGSPSEDLPGRDDFMGYGRVNAFNSLALLAYDRELFSIGQGAAEASFFQGCFDRNGLNGIARPISLVFQEGNGEIQLYRESDGEIGAIMLTDGSDSAYYIHGGIYAKYHYEMGRGNSVLGYPISDEGEARPSPYGTLGRYSNFEHGAIQYIRWPETHSAYGQSFAVHGPIWDLFRITGYAGWHGFPTSDVRSIGLSEYMDVEDGYFYSYNGQPALYFSNTSPASLTANVVFDHLHLQWLERAAIETRQWIRRNIFGSPLLEGDTLIEIGADVSSYDDYSIQPSLTYLYQVIALADTVQSPPSNDAYGRLQQDSADLYINTAEYFFDSDPGVGSGTLITFPPQDEVTLTRAIDLRLHSLTPSFHRLYLRYRDSRGVWSAAEGRSLYVTPPTPGGNQILASAEYYLDNDPGVGQGQPIDFPDAAEAVITRVISPFVSSTGFHRLFLRFRTTGGVWSAVEGRSLYVTPDSGDSLFIAGGEVFIDSLGGYGQGIAFIADDGTFDESVESMYKNYPVSSLALGRHYVLARVRDNRDLWSNVVRDSFNVATPAEVRLVAMPNDSAGQSVRLVWTSFPGAVEYHVHYDSVLTGQFVDFVTVAAQDTSLVVQSQSLPNNGRRFYYVIAILPAGVATLPHETPQTDPKGISNSHRD